MFEGRAAKEDQKLDVFHLIWPSRVPDRVLDRHHALRVNRADIQLGDGLREAHFAQEELTLVHRDELLLLVAEAGVHFLDLRLVLLQDLVHFDRVAVISAEILAVHGDGMRVDQLLDDFGDALSDSFDDLGLLVLIVRDSDYHFEELIPGEIGQLRVDVLIVTHTRRSDDQVQVSIG